MTYLNRILTEPTPQSEPLPGMVPNSANGHVYPVDDMTRLRRFLILGSEGGSYYADERKLTLENAAAVKRCITASEDSGMNAVTEIARIGASGRAPKPGPVLFALAMAASYGSDRVRQTAFNFLNDVARTGSQLQMFIDYIGTMRGWGRGLRRAVGEWYTHRPVKQAVYQAVKYRQRYNWTHRDLLSPNPPKDTDGRREESGRGGEGATGEIAWVPFGVGRSADGLHRRTGAPMAVCGSCDARDGERIRSRELSRTGLARVCGDLRLSGGWVADGAVRPGVEWLAAGPRRG